MGRLGWAPQSSSSAHVVPAVVAAPPLVPPPSSESPSLVVGLPPGFGRGGAALAVGGGISALTWLGRRNRRQVRALARASAAAPALAASPSAARPRRQEVDSDASPSSSSRRGHRRCKPPSLRVHFLYATPLVRPGSSLERLPPLSWEAEAEAVRSALGIGEADEGWSDEASDPGAAAGSLRASAEQGSRAELEVTAATVEVLSRLATKPPAVRADQTWWHIAAHSDTEGRLILEDEDGGPRPVSMAALAFSSPVPPLGVLVLACAGEQAGRALLASGASFAVVACGPLRDLTARTFTSHFYRRLFCAASGSCALQGGESLSASRVRFAFRAAQEMLRTSTSSALRAEASQLALLERGTDGSAAIAVSTPRRASASAWKPVAMTGCDLPLASLAEEVPQLLEAVSECESEEGGSSLGSTAPPQDCEDFVGRGEELQKLLQLFGAPGGRRLFVLHGPSGSGKSALGAELCRFATAPGRRFAPVRGYRQRLAYVSLRAPCQSADEGSLAACARLAVRVAAGSLAYATGRVCLLVDHADSELGWRDELVPELLDRYPQLCLLLMRRSPLYRLESDGGERWKPVNLALGPLPDVEATQLFLKRLHRPLFEWDFQQGAPSRAKAEEPLLPDETLLRRLAELPALTACNGLPRQVARLAAEVTWELPSLLELQPSQ
eukprot:TRINITY_DN110754_c0_g1_i1.p1 TRINITY_DN110754_c0_g1~~TRINITY_DN110754_c0_g1_i1.p1  ORF type:complete len:670 (+),score=118.06 TRINITY_DN110754_c0_g1_i1:98-2107(+)